MTKKSLPSTVSIKRSILRERDLYEPVRAYLINMLKSKYNNYHLEITANGHYSETLKHVVHHDIVFSFLKTASPDLTGYILKRGVDPRATQSSDVQDFITVEVKPREIKLKDIFQAKMYGDLFYARYALLLSPEIIGEEIRRLQDKLYILNRFRKWRVYVGQVIIDQSSDSVIEIKDSIWHPVTPF